MVPKMVMIIDDDRNDRFFFKTSLNEIDPSIECLEARNCMVALAMLEHADWLPDFIFLDSFMPGMSGAECLQELKKDARLWQIPIIMYSSSFSTAQRAQNIEMGAAHSLPKSADFMELPESIKKAMEIVKVEAIKKLT
jgi:CheY-like chemotaxis protein